MMTLGQVREIADLGHEIGAHTVNHPKLSKVPVESARREMLGSKDFLENLLGSAVTSFAYPKGDYNDTVKSLVTQIGFLRAVTVREGLVDSPDWIALPRIWISNRLSDKGFEAKLSPALRWYTRLKGNY